MSENNGGNTFVTQQAKTLAGLKAAVDEAIRIHGCECVIECGVDIFTPNDDDYIGNISHDAFSESE